MDYMAYGMIGAASGAITLIGGAYMTIRKIARDSKGERKELVAEILQQAKEEDSLIKAKLESRLEALRAELKNLEFNINKDVSYLRETQRVDMRNLADKLETLREELRGQHGQLVQLLTTMVGKD